MADGKGLRRGRSKAKEQTSIPRSIGRHAAEKHSYSIVIIAAWVAI
jgi:hypothetical protein